jgi:ABC-type Mn2+/Zn2+ transport system permease subunit
MTLADLFHDLLFDYTLRTIALGAATLGIVSGVLGCFAVLRRQSLMGDALSHAALPGICLAFILTGSKAPLVLFAGAGLTGWLGMLAILWLVRRTRLPSDAALGAVLTTFFGIGVVLLTLIQNSGNANQAGLDKFLFGQAATLVESDVLTMAVLGAIALAVVVIFYKEFKLLAFDPEFAAGQGVRTGALNVLLTSLLVIAVAVGLPDGGRGADGGDAHRARRGRAPVDRAAERDAGAGRPVRRAGRRGRRAAQRDRRARAHRPDGHPVRDRDLRVLAVLRARARPGLGCHPPGAPAGARGAIAMNDSLVIILTAGLLGVAGALCGSFLVLRKMGMLADAISHAVLPGLVFGYWLAQGQSLIATFLGAIIAGIVTAALTEVCRPRAACSRHGDRDHLRQPVRAGHFVVSRYFANVHLDADAVLYGEIAFAPFETLGYGLRSPRW